MTARFELDVHAAAAGFALSVRASWDAPVAAVFGPSGSGKSTLLEVIAGLRKAEGRIVLDGATVLDGAAGIALPPQARGTGWVPQEASLFPHLTAGENVLFGARRRPRDDRPPPPAPRHLAELLEIGPLWDQPAATLSGGERQRTAIARALASGPRILLLDEPLAALDLPLRARIHPYLVRVRDELKVPMLYVSHDPHELLGLAGVALRLEGGRLVACGDPRDVLWAASAAASLAPRENRLAGAVVARPEPGLLEVELDEGGRLFVAGDAEPRARVLVEFRAEDVLLAAERPGTLSAQNVLPARVTALEAAGGAVIARLLAPMPLSAQVTHRAAESLKLAPGRELWAVLKAHSARALVG